LNYAVRFTIHTVPTALATCLLFGLAGCQSEVAEGTVTQPTLSRASRGTVRRVEIGVSGGATFAGPQDTKFKRYTQTGALRDYLFARDVDAGAAPVVSASATIWGAAPTSEHLGLQFDLSHWRTKVHTEEYVNRGSPRSQTTRPPFREFTSGRSAAFLYALGRFVPPAGGNFDPARGYLYAGLGGGMVHTRVPRGKSGWAPGVGALIGWSTPITSRARFRIEGRWTITHDADAPPNTDWRVDTSGVHAAPGPAHLDTNFFSIMAGVSFRL